MTEKTAQATGLQASTAHLAPLAQKELAPVNAANGMAHSLRFATVTLFPGQEARRLGRVLGKSLSEPETAPKQRLSLQPR